VQLYRQFVSQSGEFCRHNPLCYFSTGVYCCKRIFRYRLSPETFGYTLVSAIQICQFIPEPKLLPTNIVFNIPTLWSRVFERRMNPILILVFYFLTIHFKIIVPFTPRSSKWSHLCLGLSSGPFPTGFPTKF